MSAILATVKTYGTLEATDRVVVVASCRPEKHPVADAKGDGGGAAKIGRGGA